MNSILTTMDCEQRTKLREEVPVGDRWDVEALYPSWDIWEAEVCSWGREGKEIHWPEIGAFRKDWSANADRFRDFLDQMFEIDRSLSKLYTYAHLRHDEDVGDDRAKGAYMRMLTLLYAFKQETAWVEPEILQLPETQWLELIGNEKLKEYRIHLERIIRWKPHTLSAKEEHLLALGGNALETAQKAFGALNNADMKFPPVVDSQGQSKELTHGKYGLYMRDQDRKVREGAFKNLHQTFLSYENTLCELLNGQIQRHLFSAKARHFSSCLEAALFPYQIDRSVYTSLIEAVRRYLPSLHRYVALRKQVMGLSELHTYDLQVPLVREVTMKFSYEEACEHIIASVAVLGTEYQTALRRGLTEQRWVDRYENQRKRSGAYSSGCYDSMPYILMNYHGTYNDIMTLTHEAGHSMHSFYSNRAQPYPYAQYSIFVAEVASTFHEELLFRHLLSQYTKPEEQAFLINQKIDDIRGTLMRQTLFAEFELKLHEWAEQGIPFTPSLLKEEYLRLNREYLGSDVCLDREIEIEWARIPHFYYNFYVYQYATGISAAHALAEQVFNEVNNVSSEHAGAKDRYLQFLSGGSRLYPLDLLKAAGVDMTKPDPVEMAMRRFDNLVTQLYSLKL